MAPKQPLFSVTISDCRIDTFTVGGHGGSGKDTSNTGVRVTHVPSGASAEGTRSRSQLENKRSAFVQMAESGRFQKWARLMASQLTSGKTLDEKVDDEMKPVNLKVEVRGEDGKWKVTDFELGD